MSTKYVLTQTLTTIIEEIRMIEIAISCNDKSMQNNFMSVAKLERLKINLQQLETALNAREDRSDAVDVTTDGLQQQIASLNVLINQRKSPVPLPDITVPAASLVSVTIGEKSFTRACNGVKTSDTILLTIKAMGVNYGLRGWSVPSDNNVLIKLQCPILSVGGTDIVFAATAFR